MDALKQSVALLVLAVATIAGFFGGRLLRRVRLPRVVGYVVTGLLFSVLFSLMGAERSFVKFLREEIEALDVVTGVALGFIGFGIGGELRREVFRRLGRSIFLITTLEALGAYLLVGTVTFLVSGGDAALALILAALSTATAPAATVEVLREYRASGPLTTALYAVVGLDDAVALILYGFTLPVVKLVVGVGSEGGLLWTVLQPLKEVGLSVLMGVLLGWLASFLLRRARSPEETLILTVGAVLLASGIARIPALHLSLILTNMSMGVTLTNVASTAGRRAFRGLESFTPPIYVLFFVLAGAHLDIVSLPKLGLVGLAYLAMRTAGKWLGSWVGASVTHAHPSVKRYLGFGLFCQAGVAIGLAMSVYHELSHLGENASAYGLTAINMVTATVLVLELVGPPFVKYAILKSGEGTLPV